jgi:hypothetical protein
MGLIVRRFLNNLRKIAEFLISFSTKKFGHEIEKKKAIENTVVLILTLSIYISLLIGVTLATLALGSRG